MSNYRKEHRPLRLNAITEGEGTFCYKDHVTNEDVHRKIQAAIEGYDKILTIVKQ